MTILNDNRLKKFREKLYSQKVPALFQHGGKGLNPLKKYKKDENGRPIVKTQEITRFFLGEMEKADFVFPDPYFDGLYTLFNVMSKGAEPVSFDCGFSISQEDIQKADNKTTIELLTTNIIITFFNTLKTYQGNVDRTLLAPDLKDLVTKSIAGRDYKGLVSNTLTSLTKSLEEDKPWGEYLEDINDTDLICRLAGSKLPTMKKETLSAIIAKSRREILGYNEIFTKLLHTREQTASKEVNKKNYLKSMEKIDTATFGVLKKIDTYLVSAHRLMRIMDLSPEVVIGKTDAALKQNLIWLFFNGLPDKLEQTDILNHLGIATARYRLNLLFNFPAITQYCRVFKSEDNYNTLYFDLFRLLFRELVKKINDLDLEDPDTDLRLLKQYLTEIHRAVDKLDLELKDLPEDKQAVRDAYTSLILRTEFDVIDVVLGLCEMVCLATQDQDKEIMVAVRSALLEAGFSTLEKYAKEGLPADRAKPGIKKRLHSYALHYKPQREFYSSFFRTYVGSGPRPVSPHLNQFIQTNKHFAAALLMVFSDEKAMNDLIADKQITHAAELLASLREKA